MSTVINFRTDQKTKEDIKKFATDIGVSSTSFINMVIKKALKDQSFTVEANLEPTDYLLDAIASSREDIKQGRVSSYKTKEDALGHLKILQKR